MKKIILAFVCTLLFMQNTFACGDYDPNGDYFSLFTQHIISDKTFMPFLLDYETFYFREEVEIPDANIEEWQEYFNGSLTYEQCKKLVYNVSMDELNNLKFKRSVEDELLKTLDYSFYEKYKEGIDYLIEAKYLQPYMRIKHQHNGDAWDFYDEDKNLDATDLDYEHTVSALKSLYDATENSQIKLRYGYQLVRFLHYWRDYEKAVYAFFNYVKRLNLENEVYYMALEQMAGAWRVCPLEMSYASSNEEGANWSFFEVFLHSKNRKKSAYLSLNLNDEGTLDMLLEKAETDEERIMAYFLLGYQGFNNPLSIMEKIEEINPNSEVLQVLEARAINELERSFLQSYYSPRSSGQGTSPKSVQIPDVPPKLSWRDKIVNFFKKLFGFVEDEKTPVEKNNKAIDNTARLPQLLLGYNSEGYIEKEKQQLADILNFTKKVREKAKSEFWDIAYAYLHFLQQNYKESDAILADIQTENVEYQEQIQTMRMLNDLVAEPQINRDFEEHLLESYPDIFKEEEPKKDEWYWEPPFTKNFVMDILANRYYLQGEKAKSFLIHNKLTELAYNPMLDLAVDLEAFGKKKDKTNLEKKWLEKNIDVEDPASFFYLVYGDAEMRRGEFAKAKAHYDLVKNGNGFIPTEYEYWDSDYENKLKTTYEEKGWYDGFNRISNLIFGHNRQECFNCSPEATMKNEAFMVSNSAKLDFEFIKKTMNKAELAEALVRLKEMGEDNGDFASKANQLIGNFFYNTSKLGYFRHLFVMDMTNGNGDKFHFYSTENQGERFYYKNYWWTEPKNASARAFELAWEYYTKAWEQGKDENLERSARIVFQLASAEQGLYYQWVANQPELDWRADNWYEQRQARRAYFNEVQRKKFHTWFNMMRAYEGTETVENLRRSCSYFDNFMKR